MKYFGDLVPKGSDVVDKVGHAPVEGEKLPAALELLAHSGYEIFALPKSLLSTKFAAIKIGTKAHDYVAVQKTAPKRIRKAPDI